MNAWHAMAVSAVLLACNPSPSHSEQARAAALLEQLLDDMRREPYLDMPRLERALAYRAALELRVLGRQTEVPPLDCDR